MDFSDQKRLLSIVGPTGVGKTSLALALCESLKDTPYKGFNLISADSRQVYKDLKIISGADIPEGFVQSFGEEISNCFYEKDHLRIYGVSILPYQAEWSVSHFRSFAKQVIEESWLSNRLPILVGGTGLYHDQLFNPSPILDIKPDSELRSELSQLNLKDLQNKLKEISPARLEKLNNSDYFNPTRLTRAIEIAMWEKENQLGVDQEVAENLFKPDRHLVIGLKDELDNIKTKIFSRVEERFIDGAKKEVSRLADLFEQYGRNKQLLSATGVREIQAYLDGQIEKSETLEKWTLREFQYAKRQLTWWKNRPEVKWFETNKENWRDEAINLVKNFILLSNS
ncbi:hypothetical protein KJZ63_02560 [Patescibacteria group bacterium]|nr:hypothetical protein [Patescibacteria group bacterium]